MTDEAGADEYAAFRARRAALRAGKPKFLKRYLTVLAVIFAAILAVGVWLKPPLEQMRAGVEEGIRAYAKLKLDAGETVPAVSHSESHDWIIAVSHTAKTGETTFFCWGGFKVTVCSLPGE